MDEREQHEPVTHGEFTAFREYLDERFRSMTWKLAAVAFAGGAIGTHADPIVGAGIAAAGLVGAGVKAALAFLR